jgi:hypothetical protein
MQDDGVKTKKLQAASNFRTLVFPQKTRPKDSAMNIKDHSVNAVSANNHVYKKNDKIYIHTKRI